MVRFTILRKQAKDFYFSLIAENGEVVLTSEGYTSKMACQQAIEAVKRLAPLDSNYDRRINSNSKFYFVMKAMNGPIIGTSGYYESMAAREYGISIVKRVAPRAIIQDRV